MPGRWLQPQRPLLDRTSENTGIDDLLALVRQGLAGMLVLRGGDGVGKTTFLDYGVRATSGFLIPPSPGLSRRSTCPIARCIS
jgi:hypothetical protein